MGLAASQARLLLLTAKNDALELQAQKIEQERLLLAQEQETIAQEYSDATSNTVYYCTITNSDGTTAQETLTLDTLAKSQAASGAAGNMIVLADANGSFVIAAQTGSDGETTYYDSDGNTVSATDDLVTTLNMNAYNTALQTGLQNGAYQLYVQDSTADGVQDGTTLSSYFGDLNGNEYFVRKSTDSLSTVSSRYYTEDDAAAKAEYDVAMARVNRMDTKLENQLNQVETQKSAVETEMDSVSSIIDSNIERTFQYFS
ncbi:MAG: hypothetical protein LUE64_05810 [Candidatus Gastranaerophilales bacterium]|nr:hypothetical protein [Candidatus Gastranaerophilales bacterium]